MRDVAHHAGHVRSRSCLAISLYKFVIGRKRRIKGPARDPLRRGRAGATEATGARPVVMVATAAVLIAKPAGLDRLPARMPTPAVCPLCRTGGVYIAPAVPQASSGLRKLSEVYLLHIIFNLDKVIDGKSDSSRAALWGEMRKRRRASSGTGGRGGSDAGPGWQARRP